MDEAELIKRSQKGDLDSFNRLVEAYQGYIYNLTLRMLGRRDAAEDATQEAFISAYRNMGKFRGGSFKMWLYRIASNVCHDQWRKAKKEASISLDELVLNSERSLTNGRESPEEYALRRELGQEIQKGLETLPQDQRMAVVLSDVQGLSYEEMAQVLNCPVGTVRSRLSRGRANLRDHLLKKRELLPGNLRHYK